MSEQSWARAPVLPYSAGNVPRYVNSSKCSEKSEVENNSAHCCHDVDACGAIEKVVNM